MRSYEIAVLLHPDLEINLESTLKKIETIITSGGGKVVKKDNWGKRKLAYPIKGQDWGLYVFYGVDMLPVAVTAIDQKLRITEEVMRYLIVSLENINYINKSTDKPAKVAETTKSKTAQEEK